MAYKFSTSSSRSVLMQKIKSEKTKPEIALRNALRKEKIRFQGYNKKLHGKPDIVILDKKIVIFIDGEFWHGYKWKEKRKGLNFKAGERRNNGESRFIENISQGIC